MPDKFERIGPFEICPPCCQTHEGDDWLIRYADTKVVFAIGRGESNTRGIINDFLLRGRVEALAREYEKAPVDDIPEARHIAPGFAHRLREVLEGK
jgi:hypothetical protein